MADQPSNPQVDENSLEQQELIRSIIKLIGDDPDREGVLDTPKRVLKSYKEIFGGYFMDPKKILSTTFEHSNYNQVVMCRNIEMFSTCEHHMIPFFGTVDIGYIPGDRVVGLSKLARLVEVFSRRLQIQEKLTEQIANAMEEALKPKGVMVVIRAKHMCMCARGIQKQHSDMVTSAIRGAFLKPEARAEFMGLLK